MSIVVKEFAQQLAWLREEKYKGKEPQKDEWQADIKRLASGEPLDYVIGFSRFLGCEIDLHCKPLIPRPETEYWVEKAITAIVGQSGSPRNPRASRLPYVRVLDTFAGSGCIGIAMLKHIPHMRVDFAEIDPKLCKQIKINCARNKISPKRYRIFQSDTFSRFTRKVRHSSPQATVGVSDTPTVQYDYIFANPPYCAEDKPRRVQKSVQDFEPAKALWGGRDGLLFIQKILRETPQYLKNGGVLYMEFDPTQKLAITRMAKQYGYKKCDFFKDQFGRWRYIIIFTNPKP